MNREEQIEYLFLKYGDSIYNFLTYYTGKKEVEDIVQEVFVKVIRNSDLDNIQNPKSYLMRIARNIAINHFHKRKVFQWVSEDILQGILTKDLTPEDKVLIHEEYNELIKGINKLKRNYKDVLVLKLVNDFSFEEIAQTLNWKLSKVKTTYYRAINKLKQLMSENEEVDNDVK